MTALRWTRRALDALLVVAMLAVVVTAATQLLAPVAGGRAHGDRRRIDGADDRSRRARARPAGGRRGLRGRRRRDGPAGRRDAVHAPDHPPRRPRGRPARRDEGRRERRARSRHRSDRGDHRPDRVERAAARLPRHAARDGRRPGGLPGRLRDDAHPRLGDRGSRGSALPGVRRGRRRARSRLRLRGGVGTRRRPASAGPHGRRRAGRPARVRRLRSAVARARHRAGPRRRDAGLPRARPPRSPPSRNRRRSQMPPSAPAQAGAALVAGVAAEASPTPTRPTGTRRTWPRDEGARDQAYPPDDSRRRADPGRRPVSPAARRPVPHVAARSALAGAAVLLPPLDAAWPPEAPRRRSPVRRRLAALLAAGLVVAAVAATVAGTQVVLARLVDTAPVTGNTFATGTWATATTWYLHNNPTPPTANTAAQFNLALNTTTPTATTLYNYDTGCESRVGRSIRRNTGAITRDRRLPVRHVALRRARRGPDAQRHGHPHGVRAQGVGRRHARPTLRAFLRVRNPSTSTYTSSGRRTRRSRPSRRWRSRRTR